MLRRVAWLAIAFVALTAVSAMAQQVQRIAAIVNDDVISAYDLAARIRLVIVSSRLPDSPRSRRRLAAQVLRTLIDERLQLQEAKRRNVTVSKRDIKRGMAILEMQNGVAEGDLDRFLKRNGVETQTVQDQLRASIAWSKLVGRRLRPRITIGDEEIDEAIARLESNRGKSEFRLAEIFLSVDDPNDESDVERAANRLVEQIRQGARFDALARQFSQSTTAVAGGELGWIAATDLNGKLSEVVAKLRPGEVSTPLRTVAGYRIVMLSERRKIAGPDPSKIKLGLKQIFIPVPGNAAPEEVRSQINLAKAVGDSVSGCTDMAVVSKEIGSPRPSDLGKFTLADLSRDIRAVVADLEVGKPSPPVKMPGGLLVLMVCERDEPETKLPSRDDIAERIMNRKLDLMARRYLRDVRRAAVVDLRT